jgi:Zn-dependent protease with chaperone function
VVLAAGARPPNPADVEEQQLVHLVEEMALAAGVPPPRVAVVDGDLLNAAVVGRSPDDATIVVPRGLLEELGRDPTGAVVADLLATVVNGDLRAALVLASVYQTFDLVGAVVAAPLSRRTRRVLRRVARLAFRRRPRGRAADGQEEQWMAEELADLAALGGLDDDAGGGASGCLTFPFLAASIAWTLTLLLVGGILITPALSALWRRRRLLADATAVELTRHPDALVAAFEHLERRAAAAPPGPWAHLFLVGPEVRAGLARRRFDQRMAELRAEGPRPGESAWTAARRKVRESNRAQADYQRALDEATAGDGGAAPAGADAPLRIGTEHFLPRMDKRLARLEAMGGRLADRPAAPVTPERPRPVGPIGWVKRGLWWPAVVLFAAVVLTVIAGLLLALLALLAGLVYMALLFQVLLLALPVLLVNQVLR